MKQRERIREQIKVVKRQFEADRTTMMNKIKLTNSRDQRSRLMIKFSSKLQYYQQDASSTRGSTRFMLSPVSKQNSDLLDASRAASEMSHLN